MSDNNPHDEIHKDLLSRLPDRLKSLLDERDGAARFLDELPKVYSPEHLLQTFGEEKNPSQRTWELVGLYYLNHGRIFEALPIFSLLYNQMLLGQSAVGHRHHKGVPLVWMHECYRQLGYPVLAKRYLMLTLCEDAISENGLITANTSGVYFRLVWLYGLPHDELTRYSQEIFHIWEKSPMECFYPEWILQELDQDWMTEFPSTGEVNIYSVNRGYIGSLMSRLGDGSGLLLERLADYLLSCMPGCRTTMRERSYSTDYDIVCSMEGFSLDFRSELGRYFVCECKDWDKPADFTTLAKFCRVLDSIKARFGIVFSREGITGEGITKFAAREQIKVFQDRGMVIVVVNKEDLEFVFQGGNFINLLSRKYKTIRLDLALQE